MGLTLRPLGKKLWETLTPQNEEAIRRSQASITNANQRINQLGNRSKGVLGAAPARQQFVQQNQAPRFSLQNAVRQSAMASPQQAWWQTQQRVENQLHRTGESLLVNVPKIAVAELTNNPVARANASARLKRGNERIAGQLSDPTQVAGAFTGRGPKPTPLPRPQVTAKSPPTPVKPAGQGAFEPKAFDKEIRQVMAAEGLGRPQATARVQQIHKASTAPQQTAPATQLQAVPGRAKSDPRVRQVLSILSGAKTSGDAEASLVANRLKLAAKSEGVKLDSRFINRYQTGQLKGDAEARLGEAIKRETDPLFAVQQSLNPDIKYRKQYVPQQYKQPDEVVDEAARQLQIATNSAKPRAFSTYEEAGQFGLSPKYQTLDQMVGANASEARRALGNRDAVRAGLESGIFTVEQRRGLSAIDGFYDELGGQIYASKKVADVVNGVMQESTTEIGKIARAGHKLNSVWQDIALAGGIPATPINFFTFGQIVKDLSAGRISVGKDFLYSMSDKATARRFAENAPLVREMAKRGVPMTHRSSLSNAGRNKLAALWGSAVNQPTFQRFMPNQYLSLAENTFNKLSKKGVPREEALDQAAATTKAFYGIVDQVAKGRSNTAQDMISALLFAPKYRESIVNTLWNTGKSVTTELRNPDYAMNRRLFAGLAITAFGYDQLNRQLNGHGMADNREGQELSLQIPYGEKDAKGNQPVINIPFMPGFMTIPRAVFNAANYTRKGEVGEAGGELFQKAASMPIATAASLVRNKSYTTEPIFIDQKIADEEGVAPDTPAQKLQKAGTYMVGQATPAWSRAALAQAQGKEGIKVAATALEAPVRFGKAINPETTRYFDAKEETRKKLSVNEKAVFDKLFPKGKNVRGEDIKDTNPNTRIERATLLRANKGVFTEVSRMQKQLAKSGQAIDPVYTLPWEKAQSVLWARSLPPGESAETKSELLYNQPWYTDFKNKENAFYTALEKKLGKRDDPYNYPEESSQINDLQNRYYQLEKGTGDRTAFLKRYPQLSEHFALHRQAVNRHRQALGLPPLEEFASSGGSGGSSGRRRVSSSVGSAYKYAVSINAAGKPSRPKISVAGAKGKAKAKKKIAKPKVSIRKA